MYLVICEGCWGRGKTEEKARRTCQLICGRKKMVNYLVYETDDETVEVSRLGNILREKTSERLSIIRRVKEGVEVVEEKKPEEKKEEKKDEPDSKTEVKVTEEKKDDKKNKKEDKKSKKKK